MLYAAAWEAGLGKSLAAANIPNALNPYSQRGTTARYTFVLAVLWVVFGIELTPGGSARTAQAVEADQAVEVLEHHEALSHGVAPDDITREFAWQFSIFSRRNALFNIQFSQ